MTSKNINSAKISETITTIVSSPQTLAYSNAFVICNSTSNFNLNLPDASTSLGFSYKIKNINTGVVTVDASQLIEDELTQLVHKGDCLYIVCDGNAWYIS